MTAPTHLTARPVRPATHRLAGWLCLGLGTLYILLTPIWFMLAVAWGDVAAAIFWILVVVALAAIVVGIVLLVKAAKALRAARAG